MYRILITYFDDGFVEEYLCKSYNMDRTAIYMDDVVDPLTPRHAVFILNSAIRKVSVFMIEADADDE